MMGRGFDVWELVGLYKQVRKLWPAFRQSLRKEIDLQEAQRRAQAGGAAESRMPDAPPPRTGQRSDKT